MSHGQGTYQGGHPGSSMSHQMSPRAQPHHFVTPPQINDLAFGLKNLSMSQQPVPQHHLSQQCVPQQHMMQRSPQQVPMQRSPQQHLMQRSPQANNGLSMQDMYHPTDRGNPDPRVQSFGKDDFLNSMGMGFPQQQQHQAAMQRSPMRTGPQNNMASAVSPPGTMLSQMGSPAQMVSPAQMASSAQMVSTPQMVSPAQMAPLQAPVQQAVPPTNLSVAANVFVPVFRKPEKTIVLYTIESFKKKSKVDDEMAINDVSMGATILKCVAVFKLPKYIYILIHLK